MNIKKIFTIATMTVLFFGCSGKDAVSEYDKPALYWYKSLVKEIVSNSLDRADSYYISLRSEHSHSPLLPTATMLLAQTHMDKQEYIMADYYLDEYLKKYASGARIEQAKFLKIKAAFLGVTNINRDQKLMIDTLEEVEKFVKTYPKSVYLPVVETVKVRLNMAQYLMNENIANLYERLDKQKAAKIYHQKNAASPLHTADIKAPTMSFFDRIFN